MEVLAQANTVLTSLNSVVVAQSAQMTETINAMQMQLKNLSATSKTQQEQRGNMTVGDVGEISLIGEKHALPIKWATKRRPTTRKYLGAVKMGVNDG